MQKRILVVEDDNNLSETIEDILKAASYEVIVASDGRDAVSKLLTETPHLIISDIMMPKMNGFELLEFVQRSKNLAHIPFVFLTAKSSVQDMKFGMLKGVDVYLTKPFNANDLLEMIKIRLKKSELIKNQLEEIKENIALSIPHEFRTPLTPILGYSGMMIDYAETLNPDEIAKMGKTIKENALRLLTTVEKFILFSSIYYELNHLKRNETLLNSLTENIEPIIRKISSDELGLNQKTNGIEFEIEESCLKIDEYYFNICIKELLDNAFKFSLPNTIIKISGKIKNDLYELSFENTGCGFTKEQIERINIFNKRYNPSMPGSGLGLSIIKKISEYFGCKFKVVSEPLLFTKVTRVTIHIPIAVNR